MLDSLVRVSRRVNGNHFVSISTRINRIPLNTNTLHTALLAPPHTKHQQEQGGEPKVARVVVSSMGHTAQLTVYNSFPKQTYISASPLLHPPLMLTCHAEKCTVATHSHSAGSLAVSNNTGCTWPPAESQHRRHWFQSLTS